jgi:hypothetical protein
VTVNMKLLFLVGLIAGIALIISITQLQAPKTQHQAFGQQHGVANDEAQAQQAAGNIKKMGDIATECTIKMQINASISEHCMNIVRGFNEHMSRLFNETKDDIDLILYH